MTMAWAIVLKPLSRHVISQFDAKASPEWRGFFLFSV